MIVLVFLTVRQFEPEGRAFIQDAGDPVFDPMALQDGTGNGKA